MHISKRSSFFAVLFVMALAFGCGGGGGDGDGGGGGGGNNPGGTPGGNVPDLTLDTRTSCPALALNADAPKQPSVFVDGTKTCGVISASESCLIDVIGSTSAISTLLPQAELGNTFSFILCEDSATSPPAEFTGFIRSGSGNRIYSWNDLNEDDEIQLEESLLTDLPSGFLSSTYPHEDTCGGTGTKEITLSSGRNLEFNKVCVRTDESDDAVQIEYEFSGTCAVRTLREIRALLTPAGQETLEDLIVVLNDC